MDQIRRAILRELKEQQKTKAWLAKEVGVDQGNCLKMLNSDRRVGVTHLANMLKALNMHIVPGGEYDDVLNQMLSGELSRAQAERLGEDLLTASRRASVEQRPVQIPLLPDQQGRTLQRLRTITVNP